MLPEIACEELGAALDGTVEAILDEVGLVGPPVDAFAVARALGVQVAVDDGQPGRGRMVRLADYRGPRSRPMVVLQADARPERRHWALAHELGECFSWRAFAALGVDAREAPSGARETVANQLANRLLLPRRWLARDAAECDWDLFALKARYATASHELIARRMLDFPTPLIISIFDQDRISLRRSNVRGSPPGPSAAELACRGRAHRGNEPQEVRQGLKRIRAWPIHESDWRREILRLELEEL